MKFRYFCTWTRTISRFQRICGEMIELYLKSFEKVADEKKWNKLENENGISIEGVF